jgi:hypothetical protein
MHHNLAQFPYNRTSLSWFTQRIQRDYAWSVIAKPPRPLNPPDLEALPSYTDIGIILFSRSWSVRVNL